MHRESIEGILKTEIEKVHRIAMGAKGAKGEKGEAGMEEHGNEWHVPEFASLPILWDQITKTGADVLNTIANWANIISQFGALTTAQITSMLTNWANVITALGNLAWSQVTKTYTDICNTLGSWANIVGILGNVAWSQITKTATDVMNTIASWANILTKIGAMTATQIATTLTNWATVVTGLGNLAWSQVTKTATDIMNTIANWANIITKVGAMTIAQITTTLTNWSNVISSLGNIATTYLTGTIQSAQMALTSFASGFWTGATALGKFAENFFPWSKLLISLPTENILMNGDFEIANPNDSTKPDTWDCSITSGTIALDTAQQTKGKQCVKLHLNAGASEHGYILSDYMTVRDGMTYIITLDCKASVAGKSFAISFHWFNKNKSEITANTHYKTTTTGWTRFVAEQTSASGSVYLKMEVWVWGDGAYDIWWDDARVKVQIDVINLLAGSFFTATTEARNKFVSGFINNPLVESGIQAAKILLDTGTYLSSWQYGSNPTKIEIEKLSRTETVLADLNTDMIGYYQPSLPQSIPARSGVTPSSYTYSLDLGTDNDTNRLYLFRAKVWVWDGGTLCYWNPTVYISDSGQAWQTAYHSRPITDWFKTYNTTTPADNVGCVSAQSVGFVRATWHGYASLTILGYDASARNAGLTVFLEKIPTHSHDLW